MAENSSSNALANERTELAEDRTDWAEDRTIMANERHPVHAHRNFHLLGRSAQWLCGSGKTEFAPCQSGQAQQFADHFRSDGHGRNHPDCRALDDGLHRLIRADVQPIRFSLVGRMNAIQQTQENNVRFIIRTIAAGAISIAAKIIIKKMQEKNQPEPTVQPAE